MHRVSDNAFKLYPRSRLIHCSVLRALQHAGSDLQGQNAFCASVLAVSSCILPFDSRVYATYKKLFFRGKGMQLDLDNLKPSLA